MSDNSTHNRAGDRSTQVFENPFRPGAGHKPPHLAGRKGEERDFKQLLTQNPVLKNLILTGLRGVGKTVLLDAFRPIALHEQWGWVGTDMSESASVTEDRMAIRILTDLSVFTSGLTLMVTPKPLPGFTSTTHTQQQALNYQTILKMFNDAPGLISDKLKFVLERVWETMVAHNRTGIVFAYDEAQNLSDHVPKEQFPLSVLLDVFQSIQRKGIRFVLALTGLPTLQSRLVESRTYSERMFHVMTLGPLTPEASREAITIPIKDSKCPFSLSEQSVDMIVRITGGYPYFIQFVCREVYDIWLQGDNRSIPIDELLAKLDVDFFSGRWDKATNRQRELLRVAAQLPNCEGQFTVQDIVNLSKQLLEKPFNASNVNHTLALLQEAGLVYKNRHGKYSFAVPLLGQFIQRQSSQDLSEEFEH